MLSELRDACATVAERARHVEIRADAIPVYAATLPLEARPSAPDPAAHLVSGTREELAAFWLTLDAINFGSGWFPTLRKPAGRSGYFTIADRVRERFVTRGRWSADELAALSAALIAAVLGQDPAHELMSLFAASLNHLGNRITLECDGRFTRLIDDAGGSAAALVECLARWECFADASPYDELSVPFLKRAQIAAADVEAAGVATFGDLGRLTMFADNVVPHVLRLDGILRFEPALVERIERRELIEHGSPEEVEIRASAIQAVELIVDARRGSRASDVDHLLWNRGQGPYYKASPRHRSRCTAY